MKSIVKKIVYADFPPFVHPFLRDVLAKETLVTKKTGNLILNRLEMKLRRKRLLSYPYFLYIDPTNICNLKCPLCPTWQDTKGRPKGKMPMETFKKILDETGPYLFALSLFNWGEPLLNPDLPAMIKYAKQYNMVVGISTNLHYLPDNTARELVESGIDIIIISLDGAIPESYEKYRRGGNMSTVLKNIEKLIVYKGKETLRPLLVWQFLVNRYNESEIDAAREMAQKLGLQFFPSPMRTSMGKELLLPLYERVKEMKEWLPENPVYNKYAYDIKPGTRTRQRTCKWLWNAAAINWDGSVSPCCGVFDKMWDFETCFNNDSGKGLTFRQVWNSSRYRIARELIAAYMKKTDHLPGLFKDAEKQGLICSKCITYGFLED